MTVSGQVSRDYMEFDKYKARQTDFYYRFTRHRESERKEAGRGRWKVAGEGGEVERICVFSTIRTVNKTKQVSRNIIYC